MAKQSKCVRCKNPFNSEEMIIRSNKKYCPECLKQHDEEMKLNRQDWDILFEYICEKYKMIKPTGMMFKQLKEYRADFNYTDIGMYYTLKYYYDILENDVLEGSGVGIIPYYYDKAKSYYARVYDIAEVVESYENTEEIIEIKTRIKNNKRSIKKPISLDLAWGGGEDKNFE